MTRLRKLALMLAAMLGLADRDARHGRCRSRPLHRQLRQPDHRHLLVVPVPDLDRRAGDLAVEPARSRQPRPAGVPVRSEARDRDGLLGAGAACRCQHEAVVLRQPRRDETRSGFRYRLPLDLGSFGGGRREPVLFELACPLVCLSADLLDGDRRRFPVPGIGLDRHSLHLRDRSAVAGFRAHRDHQPRSRALRQPAGARRLCGRLRRLDREAADRRDVLVRGLPGIDVSDERQCLGLDRACPGLAARALALCLQAPPRTRLVGDDGVQGPVRQIPDAGDAQAAIPLPGHQPQPGDLGPLRLPAHRRLHHLSSRPDRSSPPSAKTWDTSSGASGTAARYEQAPPPFARRPCRHPRWPRSRPERARRHRPRSDPRARGRTRRAMRRRSAPMSANAPKR